MVDAKAQDARWRALVEADLSVPGRVPFEQQWALWRETFAGRPASAPPPAAYHPSKATIENANVTLLQRDLGLSSYATLHKWSVQQRDEFWERTLRELRIPFRSAARAVREGTAEDPRWIPGAWLNVVDACFANAAPSKAAILVGREGDGGAQPRVVTYGELDALSRRVARGFAKLGLQPGDAVALYLPMTVECVAAYLGIIRAGGVVVSIADSFAPPEVAMRNRLGNAKAILTVGAFTRAGKTIDLYTKVRDASTSGPAGHGAGPRAIIIGGEPQRDGDLPWEAFLGEAGPFESVAADPYATTNILFSSGTTGEPKAIPWTHLTPIKAAMDGRYHQDVHPEDVVGWPTSIGWMMGPWLIYATLINGATMALYEGAPNTREFLDFVARARVSVLGIVPAIVRAWRAAALVDQQLSRVRVFSSTGEASNVEDHLWLMSTAGYRAPVIEYCGGTEIGGGHITGTVVQPQSPATFSTPALGLDFVILDERHKAVAEGGMGELFLVPPSIGLSQRLLNRDHHKEYYDGAPKGPHGEPLRRHGDEVQRLPGGYWSAHGRADDTMNLGGIKVSSLELERVMDRHPDVYQSAAVAVIPAAGGADELVVFVVPKGGSGSLAPQRFQKELHDIIKRELNPLYRIHDVVLVDALPRTASNKIMRRELRKSYQVK